MFYKGIIDKEILSRYIKLNRYEKVIVIISFIFI
jgi:hypothetical protein